MVHQLVKSFKKAHPVKQIVLIIWSILFFSGILFSIFFLAQYGIEEAISSIVGKGLSIPGVLIFILIFILRNVLYIPVSILLVISPVLFGLWNGILIAGIGAIISDSTGFWISRYYGKEFVAGSKVKLLQIVNQKVENHGVISVILLRIIPIFPGDIINFGAGISKIKYRDFLWATSISVWPDCFFYGFLGGSFANPLSFIYAIVFGVYIALTLWYLKNHPEYRKLFIMKLRKKISRTKKQFTAFRKRNKKKRY